VTQSVSAGRGSTNSEIVEVIVMLPAYLRLGMVMSDSFNKVTSGLWHIEIRNSDRLGRGAPTIWMEGRLCSHAVGSITFRLEIVQVMVARANH
jgi:hypothetical protein